MWYFRGQYNIGVSGNGSVTGGGGAVNYGTQYYEEGRNFEEKNGRDVVDLPPHVKTKVGFKSRR